MKMLGSCAWPALIPHRCHLFALLDRWPGCGCRGGYDAWSQVFDFKLGRKKVLGHQPITTGGATTVISAASGCIVALGSP